MQFSEIIKRKQERNKKSSQIFGEIGQLNDLLSKKRKELIEVLKESDEEKEIFFNASRFIEAYCNEHGVRERIFDDIVNWRPGTAIEVVRLSRLLTEEETLKLCESFNLARTIIQWKIKEK